MMVTKHGENMPGNTKGRKTLEKRRCIEDAGITGLG
jgi:hypothetical protein